MAAARKLLHLLAFAALLASACGGADSPASNPDTGGATESERGGDRQPGQKNADAAPDFTVQTFDGERFSLAEQKGTPVVLNFWESW